MHDYQTLSAPSRAAWALILAAALATGCGRQSESATRSGADLALATPVIVAEVEILPEETRVQAVGTSRALRSVTLYPASAGLVTAVDFEPGQAVRAGQVLLSLDDRQERLDLDLARVQLADAERELARFRGMQGSGAVTQSQIDAAASAVQSAHIALERARIALADRQLLAPFDGHIGISEVDPGDRIGTDTVIATLDDRSALLVSFEVPEVLVGRLRSGESIALSTWARSAADTASGQIVDLDSRINPVTRTFLARARVANADDRLRPGMSFRIDIALRGADYPVVPEVAVQWGGDGAFVWRVESGRAHRVGVDIVQRRLGRVLVAASLEDGHRVVVEGVQRMREGLEVSFLESAERADPEALRPAGSAAQ